jgi:hypothetical protein
VVKTEVPKVLAASDAGPAVQENFRRGYGAKLQRWKFAGGGEC